MTDITVTGASVTVVSGTPKRGIAGATITAGQPLYADAADGNSLKPADVDASAAAANVVGIALNPAADGQPVGYLKEGIINIGATVVVGTIYVASDTAGGIMPAADLEAGDYVTILGPAITAGRIQLKINVSGVQVPA